MSKGKTVWQTALQDSEFGKGRFTEQMKQEVIERIQRQNRRKQIRVWYGAAAAVCMLLAVLVAAPFERLSGLWQPREAAIADNGNASLGSGAARSVKLSYSPAANLSPIPQEDKGIRSHKAVKLPLSSVIVKRTEDFAGIGSYVEYVKSESDPTLFFGFELAGDARSADGSFYEIGYGALTDVHLQSSSAFGDSTLRMSGTCGPERRCAYWIAASADSVTVSEQRDASVIYEEDLDRDGMTEAVVLTNEEQIYIYKRIAGSIQSVHVQEALQAQRADDARYVPYSRQFQVAGQAGVATYQYAAERDELLLVD